MHARNLEVAHTNIHASHEPWTHVSSSDRHVHELETHGSLFCEGDDASFIYEVLDGVLCNYRLLADGRRQVISFAYPGDLIGLGGETHHYNCDAISNAAVRSIPRSTLLSAARECPDLGHKLFQMATSELADMQDCYVMLGRKSAVEKIASFLLGLARRYENHDVDAIAFDLPMTRSDIADFLGLTIETVSRNFTKLKMNGVIDLPQSSRVIVRDMVRLEELSEEDSSTF